MMGFSGSTFARTLLHILVSAAGGALLGLIGGLAGSALGHGLPGGFADLIGGILLGALGYVVGAGLASSLAGPRLNRPTPWWLALVASAAAGVAVLLLAEPLRLNQSPPLLQAVFVIAAPVAAVLIPPFVTRAPRSR